jgi:hypothetical protein
VETVTRQLSQSHGWSYQWKKYFLPKSYVHFSISKMENDLLLPSHGCGNHDVKEAQGIFWLLLPGMLKQEIA